ncbi:BTB/POZ domain-containing protein KCTD7 [Lingula anatina]|uniref:BTB/POZ domain-containing protein KCTD7 n=1 Tax=Lingula anatina TaxID=7574 RepID=A0A1S3HMW5_LINAN|nr:BTB/POZ domain-containing protein KCTD7 [Lingula anatina]|eukprot:XP_013386389.1 BTB/POZ domain-containing protein KCTD7 [Lingula anatina]
MAADEVQEFFPSANLSLLSLSEIAGEKQASYIHSNQKVQKSTGDAEVLEPSDEKEKFPRIVPLNVGGIHFMTRLSTLTKYSDSMLAAMFSGRHHIDKDKDGNYFIDSNGRYFGYILEYLRHGTLAPKDVAEYVYKEAMYYGLYDLMEQLTTTPRVSKLLVSEAHRAQFPNYFEVKQRTIKTAVENATVLNKAGEVIIYAFRKEFVPKAPNFNTNHNCVADQAHINVGPWEALADEETFIRCLENDLVEDGFNVMRHEAKRRCKYYYGQNCQKCIYRIQIVFS